ncbi:hypothetical protein [Gynurincola endophyticus]|uniref:hypothetical protein n=1 Tax=Gynurincola endophyticus TaxID=2479004 RepID=UPI000F8E864F|nr:hypothetical protein [Gynurincola endophyticus]
MRYLLFLLAIVAVGCKQNKIVHPPIPKGSVIGATYSIKSTLDKYQWNEIRTSLIYKEFLEYYPDFEYLNFEYTGIDTFSNGIFFGHKYKGQYLMAIVLPISDIEVFKTNKIFSTGNKPEQKSGYSYINHKDNLIFWNKDWVLIPFSIDFGYQAQLQPELLGNVFLSPEKTIEYADLYFNMKKADHLDLSKIYDNNIPTNSDATYYINISELIQQVAPFVSTLKGYDLINDSYFFGHSSIDSNVLKMHTFFAPNKELTKIFNTHYKNNINTSFLQSEQNTFFYIISNLQLDFINEIIKQTNSEILFDQLFQMFNVSFADIAKLTGEQYSMSMYAKQNSNQPDSVQTMYMSIKVDIKEKDKLKEIFKQTEDTVVTEESIAILSDQLFDISVFRTIQSITPTGKIPTPEKNNAGVMYVNIKSFFESLSDLEGTESMPPEAKEMLDLYESYFITWKWEKKYLKADIITKMAGTDNFIKNMFENTINNMLKLKRTESK